MNTNERLRVLYVEDDCDSFEMLKVMLSLAHIEVDCATSEADALALAGASRFDLYLLDGGSPEDSGFRLCRTLRASDPDIPVLFYSGNAHPDQIAAGMASGADGYITKPNSDELAEAIIRIVTSYREKVSIPQSLPTLAFAT